MAKKVLICGSTGFIGRNVAQSLAANPEYEVTGTYFKSTPFHDPNMRFVKADLTVRSDVRRVIQDAQIVVHTAAITSGFLKYKAESDVTDNIVMNSLIIQSCFDFDVEHFLYPSCTIVYSSSDKPLAETDYCPAKQIHPKYFLAARMKKLAEDMCETFSKSNMCSTKFTIFRHSNIYGPYDKFSLEFGHVFAASFVKAMSVKRGGSIDVFGTGEDKRDLLYIDDLVDFVSKAISNQTERFELLNVGLGSMISIGDLCRQILDIAGKSDVGINFESPKGSQIVTKVALDCSEAKRKLGWFSGVSLEDGIKKTIEWYRLNMEKSK